MDLAVVRDLREPRTVTGPDELAALGTDMLAGFILAWPACRASGPPSQLTASPDQLPLEQHPQPLPGQRMERMLTVTNDSETIAPAAPCRRTSWRCRRSTPTRWSG